MAVPGRKLTDFPDSTSSSSEEDFDQHCDPCLTIGQHIETHGFCVDCQEKLCTNCFDCHKRTKASKNHELISKNYSDKQSVSSRDSNHCTEKCQRHKEVIKFFCKQHELLGCTDCMTLGHRTCDLDYIPDVCVGISDSDECKEVTRKVDQRVEQVENLIQQATVKNNQTGYWHDSVIKEISKSRKEINDHLDKTQMKMETVADRRQSSDKQKLEMVLEKCTRVSSDMKRVQSHLQDGKRENHDAQLYIAMKRAKCKLSSDEINEAEEVLEDTKVSYVFQLCECLQNILSDLDVFGRLDDSTTAAMPSVNVLDGLTLLDSIRVRTKSDMYEMFITGFAALSKNKVMMADYNNKSLKVLDTELNVITEVNTLDSEPWDIAVLPQDQIAVTIPEKEKILIMTTVDKLSIVRVIPVKGRCRGISFHQDHIFVVCKNPSSVLSMDIQGNDRRQILLDSKMYAEPRYIVTSEDSELIFVSEHTSNSVLCITQQGEIMSTFCHDDLYEPEGMILFDDMSLIVCGYDQNAILHISTDFKRCQKLASEHYPQAIGCSFDKQKVYIGHHDSDQITVFSLV